MIISKFHTVVDIPEFSFKTGYSKANMFVGSCFTENIGNKMAGLKYNVDINPFGILYNPFSVANGLEILLQNKEFKKEDLVQADGLFHSFFHHGRFSSVSHHESLEKINTRIKVSSDYLKSTDFLFITFGTSWVYKFKKTDSFVSNCHKIPAKEFERERLSVNDIVTKYKPLLTGLKKQNPKIKIVFTVSPVRHWKDGAVENQRSKAVLLLAIDEFMQEFGEDFCNYFPAYEIVMDELRDYRYYAEDMIHISQVAVDYIWQRFEESLIEKESRDISKKAENISKAFNHKPFNKNTVEHLKFLKKMLDETKLFERKAGHINLDIEKKYFATEIDKIQKEIS
jgi:hypothetical protein